MAPLAWRGLLLALLTCASAVKMKTKTKLHLNPIRRVVSLLQMMEKKVTEEGEKEKQLFDEFMCRCKKSQESLGESIAEAQNKIPQLQSDSTAGEAEKSQLTSDIKQAEQARAAAQTSLDEAKSVRAKEADAHAKQKASDHVNLASMTEALAAIKKGQGDSFLQTSGVDVLRRLATTSDLADWDRKTLVSFLSSNQGEGQSDAQSDSTYEADTGDIIGIISQMKETLEKDISDADVAEKKAVDDYNSLWDSKQKELGALAKELETKNARLGEVGVELVTLANNLADTSKMLKQDQSFLAAETKSCEAKGAHWNERSKTRSEELRALSETKRLLNNDDAAHLFKNALPSSSFMQLDGSNQQMLHAAREALAKGSGKGPRDPRLQLISMAMHGRKVNFDKVLSMVDKMISLLSKEQKDDEAKVQYCKEESAKADDEKDVLENSIHDTKNLLANAKAVLETLGTDISKLAAETKALDESVAEATKQRKLEHNAFVDELASDNAAIEILQIAKDRLNKFYNPQQAALASKTTVRGVVALQSAFSFMQVGRKAQSNGVIALLNTLVKDIQKEVTEMKAAEKSGQSDYQQFMSESSEKHAAMAKALSAKESDKAEKEGSLQKHKKELKASNGEAMANAEYLRSLRQECDSWTATNFKTRKEARLSEISALKEAKAVLSGADTPDYSFVQVKLVTKHRLRGA